MKQNLKKFLKYYFIFLLCVAFGTSIENTQQILPQVSEQEAASTEEEQLIFDERALKTIVCSLYEQAEKYGFADKLPNPFRLCYALLKDEPAISDISDLRFGFRAALYWLADELETMVVNRPDQPSYTIIVTDEHNETAVHNVATNVWHNYEVADVAEQAYSTTTNAPQQSDIIMYDPRAPRPDAPSPTSPTVPIAPVCCDQTEILRLLGVIRTKIGTTEQCSCEQTILSILGDACAILGPCKSISSGIKDIQECCLDTFTTVQAIQTTLTTLDEIVIALETTTTTLEEITMTLSIITQDLDDTLTTIQEVAEELTATLTVLEAIAACCSNLTATVLREFNETWTILNSISTDLDGTFTMLNAIETCCSNLTATVLREFNETWTILNSISTDLDGTFTMLNAIETCCSNLTATVLREFNETWTTLNILTTNECNPVLIRQSDVGVTTYTISQPGRYIFAEDISFAPQSPQRAIDITSSGVTLDLLCHTLTQTNDTAGVDGVGVVSSLSHVTITHGAIQNFTRAGITVNSACSRITLDGITTFSCNVRGIEFLGTGGVGNQITESEIMNCKLIACCLGATGDIVLTLSQCTDVRVTNCRINQNGSIDHTLQAVRLDNALKCELKDIEANDNIAGTDFRGYELSQATYCVLKNCGTKNNQAVSALSTNRGFILESSTSCTANEFFDCFALNLSGTAAVDGFLTDTACDDNLFIRCEASCNRSHGVAATAIVHGFNVISNSRNIFIDCIARNNSAPNSTATPAPAFGAKGFELNTCTGCNLLRCLATDQSTGAGSTSVGIQVNQGSQCSIRDCQSSRHSVGFRLDPNNSTSHVFSRNFAGKNTTQYSQFPGGSTQNAGNITNINGSLNNPWSNVSVG